MRIKTITCHDVYNLGASLQAYALAAYLKQCGHDVEIIDYKPDYLSRHYSLTWVANPRFDRPAVRQAYLLAKLPGRLKARFGLRKKRFDRFRRDFLPVTAQRYHSAQQLREGCPEADVYIAGSDQIWNPVFPNGKDSAFFLDFVPEGKRRVSYAASFAVESLGEEDRARMKPWLEAFEAVSVRESSGVELLAQMGIAGQQVMDPVFLLPRAHWEKMAALPRIEDYILVYDFDRNPNIRETAQRIAAQTGKKIVSLFPVDWAEEVWADAGPREFVGAIKNSRIVLSNSFHATAFSLIFHKDFYVVSRTEGINARMKDLVGDLGLAERMISSVPDTLAAVDYTNAQIILKKRIAESKEYLTQHTKD